MCDRRNAHDAARSTWRNLRQQNERPAGKPNFCLADFVAPEDSGTRDYLGAFAVTTGGAASTTSVAAFKRQTTTIGAIMLKSLADRLAEAFAEWLHGNVRRELWGYARDESARQRGAGARGISRHSPRTRLSGVPGPCGQGAAVRVLARTGSAWTITENYAMLPAAVRRPASISRIRTARYFAVGKIAQDQLDDYAVRSGVDIETARRRLSPNL